MITNITDRERELAAERDRYQEAADKMATEHKVERDALAAENERLKAELGDLPESQREMLKTIKKLKADYKLACDVAERLLKSSHKIHVENTKLREATKLGLEALSDFDYDKRMNAITALKEALGEQG